MPDFCCRVCSCSSVHFIHSNLLLSAVICKYRGRSHWSLEAHHAFPFLRSVPDPAQGSVCILYRRNTLGNDQLGRIRNLLTKCLLIRASVLVSTALVESSRIRIFGSSTGLLQYKVFVSGLPDTLVSPAQYRSHSPGGICQ